MRQKKKINKTNIKYIQTKLKQKNGVYLPVLSNGQLQPMRGQEFTDVV